MTTLEALKWVLNTGACSKSIVSGKEEELKSVFPNYKVICGTIKQDRIYLYTKLNDEPCDVVLQASSHTYALFELQ